MRQFIPIIIIISLFLYCCNDKKETVIIKGGCPGEISLKNVPDSAGPPDYNDKPFKPIAWHGANHLEWIGYGVSEESSPKEEDEFNDGVIVITPGQIRGGPNTVLVVGVIISTRYDTEPNMFKDNFAGGLSVWFDWNYDSVFVRKERVFSNKIDVPITINKKKYARAIIYFNVTIPENFTPKEINISLGDGEYSRGTMFPPIRARLNYWINSELIPPIEYGKDVWGEVEDIRHPVNDFVYKNVIFMREIIGDNIAFVFIDNHGNIDNSIGFDSENQDELVIFLQNLFLKKEIVNIDSTIEFE